MEALLWILLPGIVAIASGLLAWFVMQARMDVALAEQREGLKGVQASLEAQNSAVRATFEMAVRAAEERAHRQALDNFLAELTVEQRHYKRESGLLLQKRPSLVLQERMYFRNIPLSDWIEHEIQLEEGMDVDRLVRDMTVFDKGVVNIAGIPRPQQRALAT